MTELLISQIGRIIQVHTYKYNIENEQKQNQTNEGMGGIIFVFLLIFTKKFSRLTGLIRHISMQNLFRPEQQILQWRFFHFRLDQLEQSYGESRQDIA